MAQANVSLERRHSAKTKRHTVLMTWVFEDAPDADECAQRVYEILSRVRVAVHDGSEALFAAEGK